MTEPIVRIGDSEVTHESLKQGAACVAGALHAHGVRHGERVAIVLRNDPNFLMLIAACGLLGAVPVPVNWHWKGEELRHVLLHSGARVAFAHSDLVAAVEQVLPDGVPLVEMPVSEELTVAYGAAAATGRHPMLDEWLSGHGPHAEPWRARRSASSTRPARRA